MPRGELFDIPETAHLLAWDHRRNRVVAYDSKREFLGYVATPLSPRRHRKRQAQGTPCTLVDQSTLRRVDGYHLLEEYAAKAWGADWDRMLTNPPEYPDSGASVCVSDDQPDMTLTTSPGCSSEDSTTGGTTVQAAQSVQMQYQRGTSTALQISVTQAALFPWFDGPVLAKVNMPSLAANLESFPSSLSINNQDTATANVSSNSFRNTTVPISASAGQTCNLSLKSTTCTASCTGRVRISAKGWLWVNYGSTRDGHYHWSMNIESVISDIEQRSSYIEFKADATSTGITNASPRCAFANGTSLNNEDKVDPQQDNAVKKDGVSPVIIAVPVALGAVTLILGIVALVVWRRRKLERERLRTSQIQPPRPSQSMTGAYPEVHPIWLPVATSHSGYHPTTTTMSPSQPSADATGSAQSGRLGEKYRAIAALEASDREDEVVVFDGTLPPAYSESGSSGAR